MKKEIELWTVQKLKENFLLINFPEYQREPNVWDKDAKQRLVDSMLRQFDIAPLYFYKKEGGMMDCVDGRQRIGAIKSFLDDGYEFRILNELYEDDNHPFQDLNLLTYSKIRGRARIQQNGQASNFLKCFENEFHLSIVMLSECNLHSEFNLQFVRLNLGTIINSGEKLHAMVGELRDICFNKLGKHQFFDLVNIPERRFSKEQTAAQILAQVFSLEGASSINGKREYTRTRHFDLQRLFKNYTRVGNLEHGWIHKTIKIMDLLMIGKTELSVIRSRAIIVSMILLAYDNDLTKEEEALELSEFIHEFTLRLKWQVVKGIDADSEYRYLIDFQHHITQGSVEKPAVRERAKLLKQEFDTWRTNKKLTGDLMYEENHPGKNASHVCSNEMA